MFGIIANIGIHRPSQWGEYSREDTYQYLQEEHCPIAVNGIGHKVESRVERNEQDERPCKDGFLTKTLGQRCSNSHTWKVGKLTYKEEYT